MSTIKPVAWHEAAMADIPQRRVVCAANFYSGARFIGDNYHVLVLGARHFDKLMRQAIDKENDSRRDWGVHRPRGLGARLHRPVGSVHDTRGGPRGGQGGRPDHPTLWRGRAQALLREPVLTSTAALCGNFWSPTMDVLNDPRVDLDLRCDAANAALEAVNAAVHLTKLALTHEHGQTEELITDTVLAIELHEAARNNLGNLILDLARAVLEADRAQK